MTNDTGHALDKRELIAAMAMQAILSRGTYTGSEADKVPYLAVCYADALLKELARPAP